MEIKDRSSVIFSNNIDKKTIKKANKSKQKYIKKYGDDTNKTYHLSAIDIPTLDFIGAKNLILSDKPLKLDDKAIIIGNIRMGFGHYRISIALASCAYYLGYTPYWMDLASFDATGSKMIREQNDMYSLASKISQKSRLFNHIIWEPLNSEGFKKLTYNAKDQKNSELLVPLYNDLDKDVPFVATHAWPAQGAIHANMNHVVNAIPDNWPMALHLAEGSIHTVQTPFAYLGYKMLNNMAKHKLNGMGENDLKEVGHYIDHELVFNLEDDTKKRIDRIRNDKPLRVLISIGGAGAGNKHFLYILNHLVKYVEDKKIVLLINFGDHHDMYEFLSNKIPYLKEHSINYFDTYQDVKDFANKLNDEDVSANIYSFYHKDIFEAVYSTNLLMRGSDILITKPSELAYYPIVKIMMKHIGGHEVYGAIHAQEYGDSTFECGDKKSMSNMIDTLLLDKELSIHLNNQILKLKNAGVYDGGYKAIELAVNDKK